MTLWWTSLGICPALVKDLYNTHPQCYTLVQQSCTLVLQIKSFGGAPTKPLSFSTDALICG